MQIRSENYETAKKLKAMYENVERDASAAWRAIPGVGSHANGLTPDDVKASPEYKKARRAYERARSELGEFNRWFTKRFAAEYKAERTARLQNGMRG